MLIQRFVIVCYLTLMLTGCAGLYEQQSPAPVYGKHPGGSIRSAPSQSHAKAARPSTPVPPPVVSTKPLESFNQELRTIEIAPAAPFSMPVIPEGGIQEPAPPEISPEQPAFSAPALPEQENAFAAPEQKIPEEVFAVTPFEPIEPPLSSFPAVGALVIAANQSSQTGNVEVAASSIDRALKIEPRNPSLYYKLALIRLKQSKPQEAEDLAKKSALLAGTNIQLKKHSWLLIAHARELRRDFKGAKQARAKADSF